MGCFQSSGCIELQCRLYRPNNKNEIKTKLKFRLAKGLTKYGSLPIIIGYNDMVRHDMTTVFKELWRNITLDRELSRAHEEEVEISDTHVTENSNIKGTGPRDTLAQMSATNIRASNGTTSGNAYHPLTDILPTCKTKSLGQDRVSNMESALEVEEIPETYLTSKEDLLDIELDDDEIDQFIEPTPYENLLNEELRDINNIDEDVDKIINDIPDDECKRS